MQSGKWRTEYRRGALAFLLILAGLTLPAMAPLAAARPLTAPSPLAAARPLTAPSPLAAAGPLAAPRSGAAPRAHAADTSYGPLSRVAASTTGATLEGRDLTVQITLGKTAGVRLSVVAGESIRGYAKRLLKPGRYLFKGRLSATPAGSGLQLRVTVRLLDGRRGRQRYALKIVHPTPATPPTGPPTTPPGTPPTGPPSTPPTTPPTGPTNHPPTDIALSGATIPENLPSGTLVGTLSATASGTADPADFTLVAGAGSTDNASFAIAGATLQSAASFDFETKATYAIRVRASDAHGATTEKAFTIAVTNVDEPPTVVAGSSVSYTENDPPTAIDPALTVADPDSAQLTGATVAITANHTAGQDRLALPVQPTITGTFDDASGILTLTGTDTVAAYQAALRAVTYENSSDNPDGATRTISLLARDAAGFGPATSSTVSVTAVNDPPTVTTSPGALSFTEGAAATPVDPGVGLTDPDSQIVGATVSISGNFAGPQDVLALPSLPAQPTITGAYDAATGVLTLSGTADAAAYEAALRAVTYLNSSNNPSTAARTLTFQATDSAPATGNAATRTIAVNATDTPPTLSTSAGSLAYTENDPPAPIDTGLTVTDPDSTDLVGATVQITGNLAAGEDVLALAAQPTITATFDPASGTLTLTGADTLAHYQAALRAVTYANTSENPSTATRTATFTARDAGGSGAPATHAIAITAVDDPPVAVDDSAVTTEDPASPLSIPVLDNDTDVDGGPKALSSFTQPANGAVVDGGGGVLLYTPPANFCNSQPGGGPDTFSYTLNGGSTATVAVKVVCVDDPPVAVDDAATVAEDSGATQIDVLANDTDIDGGPKSIQTVTQPANGVVAITGGGTGLTYAPSANYCNSPPATTADTFTYTLNGDTPATATATVSLTVTCVDDPPVASNDAATVLEQAAATGVDVLANDTDIDGGPKAIQSVTQPANGTVAITGGGSGLTYKPNASYCNDPPATTPDTFTYTLNGGSTATVSMTVTCVNQAPVPADDSFSGTSAAIGNTALIVKSAGDPAPALSGPSKTVDANVLANDSDPDGPNPLSVVPGTFASNDGGSVTIQSNGDFVFTPAAATSCTDHSDFFDYTVTDGNPGTPGTAVARVTIQINGCVWYVNNNAAGNSGTSSAPFDSLAQAQTASSAGDTIFVEAGDGTTAGLGAGIALKDNQQLIGEAATLQVGPDVLQAAAPASRPTITNSNADVVGLASGNTVRGVQLDPSGAGNGIAGGSGDAGGTIDDVRIIDSGTPSSQAELALAGTSGTFDISDLTVDAAGSAVGIRLDTNSGVVNFKSVGTIAIATSGGRALDASATNMGADSVFDAITVTGSSSGAVSMVNTSGTTTFGALDLTTSGATAAFLLSGAGSVTVAAGGTADVSATGGPAVDVSATSSPSLAFDNVSSSSSPGSGISLSGLGTGTFSASGGAISQASGTAVAITGGSGAIAYAGPINNGAGNSALVTGRTGGTVTLSGAITDSADAAGGIAITANSGGSTVLSGAAKTLNTGAAPAIAMTGDAGHTVSISGGGLAITTTAGNGLSADSGTLTVTGSGNSITTGTGGALLLDNTTIGAAGLTLQSVSANGASNAIRLRHTGASGRLAVTGNGGTCTNANTSGCSGGTIANASGGDDASATPTGTGIVLDDTLNPSFTRLWIHDASNYAIRGTAVSGLTLASSVINGANGTNGTTPFDDSSVWFDNLTGAASVTDTYVSGGFEDNFRVVNTSGSLNRITFTSDTIGDNSAAGGNDGILLESSATAGQLEGTIQSSTFTGAGGDLLQYDHSGAGAGDLVLTGNAFSNDHPGIATGGGGLTLSNGGTSGPTTISITGANTFRDAVGNALTIVKSTGPSTQTGTFSGNTIGVAGNTTLGSSAGDGLKLQTVGQGTLTWNVSNNQIYGFANFGVDVLAGGGATGQTGAVNVTVTGNTIANPAAAGGFPTNGLQFNIGTVPAVPPAAGDTYNACLQIGGPGALANTVNATGTNGAPDIRPRQRQGTTIRLPGYGGSATDDTAVDAFVAANNRLSPTVLASHNSTGFTGAGTTCP